MRAIYRLMVIVAVIAGVVSSNTKRVSAQEEPPDLRMLLNLDLFRRAQAQAAGAPSNASTAPSMLEQIRTLRAMGYLGGAKNAAAAATAGPSPSGAITTPAPANDQGTPQL
jgi:negative regulator of sigma E activity